MGRCESVYNDGTFGFVEDTSYHPLLIIKQRVSSEFYSLFDEFVFNMDASCLAIESKVYRQNKTSWSHCVVQIGGTVGRHVSLKELISSIIGLNMSFSSLVDGNAMRSLPCLIYLRICASRFIQVDGRGLLRDFGDFSLTLEESLKGMQHEEVEVKMDLMSSQTPTRAINKVAPNKVTGMLNSVGAAAPTIAAETVNVATMTAMPAPCGVGMLWEDRAFGRANA